MGCATSGVSIASAPALGVLGGGVTSVAQRASPTYAQPFPTSALQPGDNAVPLQVGLAPAEPPDFDGTLRWRQYAVDFKEHISVCYLQGKEQRYKDMRATLTRGIGRLDVAFVSGAELLMHVHAASLHFLIPPIWQIVADFTSIPVRLLAPNIRTLKATYHDVRPFFHFTSECPSCIFDMLCFDAFLNALVMD
jgi:hypothetical protein